MQWRGCRCYAPARAHLNLRDPDAAALLVLTGCDIVEHRLKLLVHRRSLQSVADASLIWVNPTVSTIGSNR